MKIERISDTVTEIEDRVRIESGPLRKQATATAEILSDDVTAKHYHEGGIDALGKKIVLGQPFDYIDWKNRERAFYVYILDTDGVWQRGDSFGTYEEALGAGIAAAQAA